MPDRLAKATRDRKANNIAALVLVKALCHHLVTYKYLSPEEIDVIRHDALEDLADAGDAPEIVEAREMILEEFP